MNDIIHLLPDSVANQIAAGEVIQRPASVIKELVENSIDAEAKNIKILVKDAGRTSIQVIDDGKGMSETDARMAFERHATSKITRAKDLFSLHTMGFRGEALASIAAVAHVVLKTKGENDELGTQIIISGSKTDGQELVSCSKGSNFLINDLFFNVPARRKFLKSNATELNNIIIEFERIVLVHPDISFSLYSNDAELYHLSTQSYAQRISAVCGKKFDQQLLTVNVETSIIKISGFVARPEFARKRGSKQYFFVNGRYMRHPYFHKAVMQAYDKLIPVDEQVSYFLYFEVNPTDIDVNIHPTKTEIKFENETSIWQILLAGIKESLGKFSEVPVINFDTDNMPYIPPYERKQFKPTEMPHVAVNTGYNPFSSTDKKTYSETKVDWETIYKGIKENNNSGNDVVEVSQESFKIINDDKKIEHGIEQLQIKGKYILISVKSGLMMIDQRRAHIRILYEKYMHQLKSNKSVSQRVLFPEVIQFIPSEELFLKQIMDQINAIGFELSNLGGGNYSVIGIPSGIEGLDPCEMVTNMVHAAIERGTEVREEIQHVLALSLAQRAAIVYGQALSREEMTTLIDDLFSCSMPNYTPDGHAVLLVINENEIEKRFGQNK